MGGGEKKTGLKNYLEKYLAIETIDEHDKTPSRRNMHSSTPGDKGYLETLRKLKTMRGVLFCARDLCKSRTVLNLLPSPPNAGITASAATPA